VTYTGGDVDHATYRNHGTHAEAIEIIFDPEQISYRDLLEFFFQIHDPTTGNRQGNDIGMSYRSAIFYMSDEQRQVAEETIADVDVRPGSGRPRWSPRSRRPARSGRRSRSTRTISSATPVGTPVTSSGPDGGFPTEPTPRPPPQLARIYYVQMVERGKDHLGACCVVAAHLAVRAWAVLHRGMPDVICHTDDRPVSPDDAKAIIAERWTVPAEVRARHGSKKVGKAPQQVLRAHGKSDARGADGRGDLPLRSSSPPAHRSVKQVATTAP
jgi:hypothetical protein